MTKWTPPFTERRKKKLLSKEKNIKEQVEK